MGAKKILLIGMAVGSFVGLLMTIISHIPLGTTSDGSKITLFYHWSGALLVTIGVPLLSAFGVRKMAVDFWDFEPSLKLLVPVAYLTFLIPVLGASFGAPNSNLEALAMIVLLGAIGGTFWSLPYMIGSLFRKTNPPKNEEE